jgi:hypothetical protein
MISKYTEELRDFCNAKVDVQPWMHIAITSVIQRGSKMCTYVVYIWDSRKIVEWGTFGIRLDKNETNKLPKAVPCNDSKSKLTGNTASYLNDLFKFK